MRRFRSYYRTSDRSADYRFTLRGAIRWDVEGLHRRTAPPYRNRATDASLLLIDCPMAAVNTSAGQRPLPSLEEAKQVAALWADKTQQYIRTGSGF